MKMHIALLRVFLLILISAAPAMAQEKHKIFEIRTYVLNSVNQEKTLDNYIENSLMPVLKRQGVKATGVFKLVGNDSLQIKKIILFIPYKNIQHFEKMENAIKHDKGYQESARTYLSSAHNKAPFSRIETVLLRAFNGMPFYSKPSLKSNPAERIYELRSYEGPTEDLYSRKVEMFNQGGEIVLFERLGFNAVFYGSVISGAKMPNLMYMTSFENMASRDEHWKTFSADPEWKKLAAMDYYKNTVSKNEKLFLYPTPYSDL